MRLLYAGCFELVKMHLVRPVKLVARWMVQFSVLQQFHMTLDIQTKTILIFMNILSGFCQVPSCYRF